MSDNLRRYRAIRRSLTQCYPGESTGHVARHLNTLAALISGIVARKSTQLPTVASNVPDGNRPESRVQRFSRWLRNDLIAEEVYFLPYAEVLLAHFALPTLVLVIDGSIVGRGCVALMIHVISPGRALPLAWQVRQGNQGHFPEDLHIALVEQAQDLTPPGAKVVLRGDGACDGIRLQQTMARAGWSSVCRTGINMTATWQGETFRLDAIATCLKPGTLVELSETLFTADAYGPIMRLCGWAKGYRDPLYLVTHMTSAEEACRLYTKRFRIEFLFRDSKQFTGLSDCQARAEAALDFHFNAALATLNLARTEQLLAQTGESSPPVFSMASWKQRQFNERLLDLFIEKFALEPSWVKNHPSYDALRAYGAIAA